MGADGALTSLSQHKGFRNYIKAKADELGLTGYVQRYQSCNVRIYFEGTRSQTIKVLYILYSKAWFNSLRDIALVVTSNSCTPIFESSKITPRKATLRQEYTRKWKSKPLFLFGQQLRWKRRRVNRCLIKLIKLITKYRFCCLLFDHRRLERKKSTN